MTNNRDHLVRIIGGVVVLVALLLTINENHTLRSTLKHYEVFNAEVVRQAKVQQVADKRVVAKEVALTQLELASEDERFLKFRIVLEVTPSLPMSAKTIASSVSGLCSTVVMSSTIKEMKPIMVAGAVQEDEVVKYKVIVQVKP